MKKYMLLAGAGVGAIVAAGLRRYWYARLYRLSRPRYQVHIEYGIKIPADDGVTLMADHYAPDTTESCPTILIRTPYGRNRAAGLFGAQMDFLARRFAERGYHVVVQDVRGRFDSEGTFEPYMHERRDGLATLAWLREQTWFNGKAAMWGQSYLGITQWAIADAPELKALFPMITASRLYDIVFPDGAFDLGLMMRWIALLILGEKPRNRSLILGTGTLLEAEWRIRRALWTLPVTHADVEMAGEPIEYYHRWLEHTDPDDPIWHEALAGVDHAHVNAPVHLTGGWYDFFLRGLLHDYAELKAAGKNPYLTIGGWHHFSSILSSSTTLPSAFAWFDAHLKNQPEALRELPVRLQIMGANEWRDFPDYPPPSTATRYYLAEHRRLEAQSDDSPPDTYCYDPAKPTPIVGGTQFHLLAGAWNNQRLERRPDVLVYTSPVLTQPLEIIGAVKLELYVRSSLEHTDFYGRLCDVNPDGKSINICDGLFRVVPGKGECLPDGVLKIEVDMWATAYRFLPGHALRLVVGSGAHPRWSRNTGSANPLRDTELRRADQTIYHDTAHPSALVLPVHIIEK